jgi:hypothetical protein
LRKLETELDILETIRLEYYKMTTARDLETKIKELMDNFGNRDYSEEELKEFEFLLTKLENNVSKLEEIYNDSKV